MRENHFFWILKFVLRYTIPIGLTLLYLLLPTTNSGIDGYAYASAIKWGHEPIWPHHLLYVPFGRILFLTFSFVQPLVLMKVVSALAAGVVLVVFQKTLKELEINYAHYFVLFVGSCFGLMRYATENETYILPVLCSIAATFYFLKFLKSQKGGYLMVSGTLFGLGVLFHQIHIFWYLGFVVALLINIKTVLLKNILGFVLSGGLLVLSVYLFAYFFSEPQTDFVEFILHDVYAGQVNTGIGLNNFVMTPISFVRTFTQVHGYMEPLLAANPVLFVLPIAFVVIGFICIRAFFKYSVKQVSGFSLISKAVFWAFIFHLGFAFYSVGNAEFMVMLPMLGVLWVVLKFAIPTKPVLYISLMLLLWNVAFGLAPARFLDLDGSRKLLAKMKKYPKAIWLLHEPQKMENIYDYYKGPGFSKNKIKRVIELASILKINSDTLILTDEIGPQVRFNRQRLINDSSSNIRGIESKFELKDSVLFFGGKKFIGTLKVKF